MENFAIVQRYEITYCSLGKKTIMKTRIESRKVDGFIWKHQLPTM